MRQLKCGLNHCSFSFSYFPPNDRIHQLFDECGEEELIANGIVGIGFSCKAIECPVDGGQILAQ